MLVLDSIVDAVKRREQEEKMKDYEERCKKIVYSIDDLLYKYDEYSPTIVDDTVVIKTGVAVWRFIELKRDMARLGLTKIKIDCY